MNEGIELLSSLIFIGALVNIWLSLVSIKMTIALLLLISSGAIKIFCKWIQLRKDGILNRLPERTRKVLLERSIFDILCDIWYFEAIKRHVRIFLGPFIIKKTPQELLESFEDMNPQLRQIVLRKGIINLVPSKIKAQITENYVRNEEEQQVKEPQLANTRQIVLAEDWDRFNDFEQFVTRKKVPKSSQTLFRVMQLLIHKPIVNKNFHQQDMLKLKQKAQKVLLISMFIIIVQLYLNKSSRIFYKRMFKISGQVGLASVATGSLIMYLITKSKSKQL